MCLGPGCCLLHQVVVSLRVVLLQNTITVFAIGILGEIDGGRLAVELQRILPFGGQYGVVAIEGPVTGIDGFSVLIDPFCHIDTVGNAVRVGNDNRRSVKRLCFQECLDALSRIGERHRGDIDGTVCHCHHSQILLGDGLAAGCELGHCAERSGF